MGGGRQKDAEFSTSEIFYYKLSELLPTKSRSLSELSKYFSSGKLSSYILKEKLLGVVPRRHRKRFYLPDAKLQTAELGFRSSSASRRRLEWKRRLNFLYREIVTGAPRDLANIMLLSIQSPL